VRRRRRRTHAALSVLAGANDHYGLREGMALSAGSSPRPSSLSFPQEALYADADRRNRWRQSNGGGSESRLGLSAASAFDPLSSASGELVGARWERGLHRLPLV
jgi:hypothetical protein